MILVIIIIILFSLLFVLGAKTEEQKKYNFKILASWFISFIFFIISARFIHPVVAALISFGSVIFFMIKNNIQNKNSNIKKEQAKIINSYEMSKEEAYKILDINSDASEEEINAAFKTQILKNHPDKGGSKYLAQKITQAKKILLKHHKEKNNV